MRGSEREGDRPPSVIRLAQHPATSHNREMTPTPKSTKRLRSTGGEPGRPAEIDDAVQITIHVPRALVEAIDAKVRRGGRAKHIRNLILAAEGFPLEDADS